MCQARNEALLDGLVGPRCGRRSILILEASGLSFPIVGHSHQHADAPHALALLPPSRERPCDSRTAEQRDERASFHSITSSARASTPAGNLMPRALAVRWLRVSSNLIGACTGRSAGFAPLRMRST